MLEPDSSSKNAPPTRPRLIDDVHFSKKLEPYSIEELMEFKVSRFFDQVGTFYPENFHELVISKVEKVVIRQVLKRVGGSQVQAAKVLGLNRNTLRKKMKMYNL